MFESKAVTEKIIKEGIKRGVELSEKSTKATGRRVGWDATLAQVVKRFLGSEG